jgi:hypothetical protein
MVVFVDSGSAGRRPNGVDIAPSTSGRDGHWYVLENTALRLNTSTLTEEPIEDRGNTIEEEIQ